MLGVIDSNCELIARYDYSTWGFHTGWSNDDINGDIYDVNPFRYRSYIYDEEMSMCYLQSRYYITTFGRFLNSDLPEYAQVQKGDHAGLNLFAYCNNDPVNNVDYDGYWGENVHSGYNNGLSQYTTIKNQRVEYGTYHWAKSCGFSKHNAYLLAFHCNDLDKKCPSMAYAMSLENPNAYTTQQRHKYYIWQGYHFNLNKTGTDSRTVYCRKQRDDAVNLWKKGKKSQALIKLAYGLHAVQDYYAHGNNGKGSIIPAHLDKNVDNIHYDWKNSKHTTVTKSEYSKSRLYETREHTKDYLDNFISRIGGKRQVSVDVRG